MPQQDPNHTYHQDAENHYEQAARNHERAAESYFEAARLREAGNQEAAANHALTAHGYSLHAIHHGEEAFKQHANIQASVQKA